MLRRGVGGDLLADGEPVGDEAAAVGARDRADGVLGTRAAVIGSAGSVGSGFGPKSCRVIEPGVPPYQRPSCEVSP